MLPNIKVVEDAIELSIAEGNSSALSVEEARELATKLIQKAIEVKGIQNMVGEWERIPMQELVYDLKLKGERKMCVCFIYQQTKSNAVRIASAMLQESGCEQLVLLEQDEVFREDYLSEDGETVDGEMQYYEQALIDGEVFVYYAE